MTAPAVAGLGALLRGGATVGGGVAAVDVITQALGALKQQGMSDDNIAKVLPSILKAAESSELAERASARQPIFRPALAQTLTAAGPAAIGYVANDLTQGNPVGANVSNVGGKYLVPGVDLDYLPYYRGEAYRRALLGLVPGVGSTITGQLPTLETPAELGERIQSRQSRAMDEANLREIALRRAEGLLAQELERIIQSGQTQRTGITEQAATQRQQIASLGNVQQERVRASYGTAKDLLGNTVSAILGTIPTGRPTEVELAKIM